MLHCERLPVSIVTFYRTTVGFSSAVLIQVALLYFSRPLNDRSGSYKTTTNQNNTVHYFEHPKFDKHGLHLLM